MIAKHPMQPSAIVQAYNALPDMFQPWMLADESDPLSGLYRENAKHPNKRARNPCVIPRFYDNMKLMYYAYDGTDFSDTDFETTLAAQDWVDARLRERGVILLTEIL